MLTGTGRCLCGAVRFRFDPGAVLWQAHCHCESCRRACSAPMTTFVGLPRDAWEWLGQAPATYASSPGVTRSFCATCGSPMAFESTSYPGEIHGYAASLDKPDAVVPQAHVHWSERMPWLTIADGLPKKG